ncbi:RDD family protein [Haladaptatus cibarius]|uniref:RDD family protein n=1 Tax=Haladaptatus cibarius TaxID=453847 RepID=UPI000A937555|nr:RDD family protein [Haladaptatus cibarius]
MPEPVMGTEEDVILNRVVALILDEIIAVVCALVVGGVIGGLLGSSGLAILLALAIIFGYHVVLEGLYGQTVGKRLLGIVVVTQHGDPCSMGASVVRNALRIIDAFFHYAVGLVVMLINDDRQRIGDIAANTVVVRAK